MGKIEQVVEMRQYKAEGHTNKEVSEKFNVSLSTSKKVCKGIAPQTKKHKGLPEYFNRILDRWEVVGEFTNAEGYIECKCRACGCVHNIFIPSVRKGYEIRCEECIRISNELEEQRRKEERERQKEEREKARRLKQIEKEKKEVAKWHECPVCGKRTNRPKYCSKACSNKANWRTSEVRRRAKLKDAMVDKDITLEKLFKRDNGICYLCGKACDWNDYSNDEWFIAGDFYPSIDHVKPLAKGGTHSWDNVRLSHRICNSLKADHIPQ